MRKFPVIAAPLLFVAAAAAQTAPPLDQISSRLTPNGLRADVSFLASDELQGRGTPSPGLEIAAQYIAAQFRRAGLEPGGDDLYFQTAHYVSVTPNLDGMDFHVEAGGQTVKARADAMTLQEAGAVDIAHGAVVKAGAGDLAALTPEQVRDKVLAVDLTDGGNAMGPMRQLSTLAARLHPSLIVLLRTGGQQGGGRTARLREAASATVPMLVVWDEAVRTVLSKNGPADAEISAHIAAPETTPVSLHNVVGVLRGGDAKLRDTYVLVTAHYDHLGVRGSGEGDHIFNGANDDASGTASVIEIANALAALPTRPRRSIVFAAFFGEELGLVGSRYYGAHPIFPLAKTVADLNLEQLGRTDVDGGSSVGLVNVTGYDFSTLTDAVRQAGEATGLKVVKDEQRNVRYFAQSDNQALADAGVPAHTLSVGYMFPDYHKAGDEWQKLDYDNLAQVDRTVALAVFRVADSLETPQWKDIPNTQRYIKARQDSLAK